MKTKRKYILFGAGKMGRRALSILGRDNVALFCDNRIADEYVDNVKVISFEELQMAKPEGDILLTVSNPQYALEIIHQLTDAHMQFRLFDGYDMKRGDDSNENIFSETYQKQLWGGTSEVFYSGYGSHDEQIIKPYKKILADLLEYNQIGTIIEIGCGDFHIMQSVLKDKDVKYCGIDIVKKLIDFNKSEYESSNTAFLYGDATDTAFVPPQGDLIIIRQVLQHLDNQSILEVLRKCRQYKYGLITEHIYDGFDAVYNIDKMTGPEIRLHYKSGVYIDKSPFNISNTIHLLKIPTDNEGCIRTSLVINGDQ